MGNLPSKILYTPATVMQWCSWIDSGIFSRCTSTLTLYCLMRIFFCPPVKHIVQSMSKTIDMPELIYLQPFNLTCLKRTRYTYTRALRTEMTAKGFPMFLLRERNHSDEL